MKIHQYTNIEALACILKNQTIRFTRLDKVDDLEEGNIDSSGVKFGKYVFASCWTDVEEENIPLWKMYGGDNGGVRISLEQEMFKEYIISNLKIMDLKSQGALTTHIPPEDFVKPDFFIMPNIGYKNEMFYRHIEYVKDVPSIIEDAIKVDNNNGDLSLDMKRFGFYKNKHWEFQNEVRFVLYILPVNPILESAKPNSAYIITNCILKNKPLPFDYYDMHLKDDAFNSLEITLSPSVTEGQRIIVQALIDKYAPKAKMKNSSLGKLIKLK